MVNEALGAAFVGTGALVGGGSTVPVPDPFTRSSLFGVLGPSWEIAFVVLFATIAVATSDGVAEG